MNFHDLAIFLTHGRCEETAPQQREQPAPGVVARLGAVMEEGLTEGLRITSEVMALVVPPEDKLVRMIRTQIGTILDDAHDFVPILRYEWRSLTPANRRRILALTDRYDALWQSLIDEFQRAGHMPGDAQLMRLLTLGAVNWVGTWYNEGGRLSLDDVAQGAARLFLRDMPQ